ncbi:tRNA (adenosine(37)-N6)-dimethylallyltransferase MiaA [Galbibacter pacificus]|uniref:tRNA dimethylallyltransferase n=1 Tax=Galbibacter pacificus TaxID=2996052 RepID=A0ABT6FPX9_9FLAO|nr:tRNA (adenosine(37)-N6)-dimethylallyltransferase MiaA [Galbibacter pacificus]MDG3582206.1 tRNA (adenosine(37)-N6)-dimethylallyltransferase MiaA [Galbibacter pacificus]MDG3585318.1 tRNA (adenosine(37)-N6)-dimethylallyltransferase MiaA [Galbibacter pacificus]
MNNKKYLITVVGPTAIGKTSLAIKLAKEYHAEIISSDSRQFYKEMRIGTAVPEEEELAEAKHHFIQHKSIFEDYSVGDFEKEASKMLHKLFTSNNFVIMAGGSGLYNDAVIKGLDDFPDIDPSIRQQLNQQLKNDGIEALQDRLKSLDPDHFNNMDVQNPHRLIRALEICMGTGKPYSSFLNQKKEQRNFQTIKIGLTAERETIYNRINQRVDIMMQNGLLEEARKLHQYKNLNALQTVGYKELFDYFDGKWTLDFAVSEIKKNTRRFAKRQLTWLRKDEDILWFDHTANLSDILLKVNQKIEA